MKVHYNKKNTNIDIEDISDEIANLLIKNIHEQIFFNKKVYCRAFLPVHTPPKASAKPTQDILDNKINTDQGNNTNNGSPVLKPNIPGLSKEDIKRAEKKKLKEDKKNKKMQKEEEKKKSTEKNGSKSAEDFMKDPTFKDFEFDDAANDVGSADEGDDDQIGFPWSKSPLECEDPEKLLSEYSFASLSAKQIQKEQLWLTAANKRALTSPTEASERRLRSKSQGHFHNH